MESGISGYTTLGQMSSKNGKCRDSCWNRLMVVVLLVCIVQTYYLSTFYLENVSIKEKSTIIQTDLATLVELSKTLTKQKLELTDEANNLKQSLASAKDDCKLREADATRNLEECQSTADENKRLAGELQEKLNGCEEKQKQLEASVNELKTASEENAAKTAMIEDLETQIAELKSSGNVTTSVPTSADGKKVENVDQETD